MSDQMLRGRRYATPHVYVTGTRQVLTHVHDPSQCEGRNCVIHAPSGHPLVNAPTHWRMGYTTFVPGYGDLGCGEIMERICPHGWFHPDPDDLDFIAISDPMRAARLSEHNCCGCCQGRGN